MKPLLRIVGTLFLGSALLAGCQQASEEPTPESSDTLAQTETNEQETAVKSEASIGLSDSQLTASKLIKDEREGIVPDRIRIPAIEVDAKIQRTPLLDNGQMGVPDVGDEPGWYEQGYLPGEPGNAVIAGHVDWTDGPAVFYDLNKLKPGDEVHVESSDGKNLTFVSSAWRHTQWMIHLYVPSSALAMAATSTSSPAQAIGTRKGAFTKIDLWFTPHSKRSRCQRYFT